MPAELPVRIDNYFPQQAYYATFDHRGYLPVISSSVGSVNPPIAWEQNTGESGNSYAEETPQNSFNTNRQFIKLQQSFDLQLEQFENLFQDQNKYALKEKMKYSAEAILNCSPDRISLQITDEGSIFYTFLKNGSTIYFQHYLIDEYDGSDEAIISIFRGEENTINFAGSLSETFTELNKVLFPESLSISEFA